jgi:hypothetical protein
LALLDKAADAAGSDTQNLTPSLLVPIDAWKVAPEVKTFMKSALLDLNTASTQQCDGIAVVSPPKVSLQAMRAALPIRMVNLSRVGAAPLVPDMPTAAPTPGRVPASIRPTIRTPPPVTPAPPPSTPTPLAAALMAAQPPPTAAEFGAYGTAQQLAEVEKDPAQYASNTQQLLKTTPNPAVVAAINSISLEPTFAGKAAIAAKYNDYPVVKAMLDANPWLLKTGGK